MQAAWGTSGADKAEKFYFSVRTNGLSKAAANVAGIKQTIANLSYSGVADVNLEVMAETEKDRWWTNDDDDCSTLYCSSGPSVPMCWGDCHGIEVSNAPELNESSVSS